MHIYRVIEKDRPMVWQVIVPGIVREVVHTDVCLILKGY